MIINKTKEIPNYIAKLNEILHKKSTPYVENVFLVIH